MKYWVKIMCLKDAMPNRFSVISRTRPFKIFCFEDNWEKFQISNSKKLIINNWFLESEIWNPP
jgi:hypothetical protein